MHVWAVGQDHKETEDYAILVAFRIFEHEIRSVNRYK